MTNCFIFIYFCCCCKFGQFFNQKTPQPFSDSSQFSFVFVFFYVLIEMLVCLSVFISLFIRETYQPQFRLSTKKNDSFLPRSHSRLIFYTLLLSIWNFRTKKNTALCRNVILETSLKKTVFKFSGLDRHNLKWYEEKNIKTIQLRFKVSFFINPHHMIIIHKNICDDYILIIIPFNRLMCRKLNVVRLTFHFFQCFFSLLISANI